MPWWAMFSYQYVEVWRAEMLAGSPMELEGEVELVVALELE